MQGIVVSDTSFRNIVVQPQTHTAAANFILTSLKSALSDLGSDAGAQFQTLGGTGMPS